MVEETSGEEYEFFKKGLDNSYVLNIVVRVEKNSALSFNDVTQAATNALVDMFKENHTHIPHDWAHGSMKKVVKRARGLRWDEIMDIRGGCYGKHNNAEVVVFPPVKKERVNALIDKLQVSGLDLETNYRANQSEMLNIAPNCSVDMTSGKLLAQVLHGVQVFMQNPDRNALRSWLRNNTPVNISDEYVNIRGNKKTIKIQDWGLTEIPEGTSTVYVLYGK